ncbi:MAG: polysaccharide biosynthesis/export family protein [Stenotrophomonas sp.]|jgi:polysaccharide export outer membrane protein|uniref:polysaccharide biosynthesis/export family protein n=1 Tax=Stenotrophomonas TaxID=40323 RepID=UPI00201CD666|nr:MULTISPECIES: polysaccharide biosynthesis/export family protein [Stenotrophomonas]MBN5026555.1 polysaccharide biosynthesis/export family protein [Stenotrophomonas maltophilia]MDH1275061.1 polysaccharide biosynthesis/export family protein [Stenotrophomonas sp. GD03937]MDH1485298.1 polysaccharide biosynthesis/export family protein [Stenotrophomonas sp. GD03712]MDR2959206.1 polysaccharide biosynthesis/export family protein [Stenotrophomonas sp.]UQY97029.1 polysaccharide biosynthesis/export fam
MDCKRLVAAMAFTLTMSGCMWAPGQHMRSNSLMGSSQQVGNDQIELIPITPKLIAMERAEKSAPGIPASLMQYQPGPYQIGAGDILYITVWDHPELTVPAGPQQQLSAAGRLVQSDGTLFYPYIGKVTAAGKTPAELRDEITTRLARYIEAPQVDVSMLTYASQRVWVTGASRQPATVPLTVTPLTLGDAVSQAGLDPAQADLSGVRLTRDGTTYTIDLDALGRNGGGDTNVFLKAGDHLYVPYLDRKEVFVVGEVNQPGAMSFKTGEISLSQALGRARGLLQTTSNGNAVYVIRGSNDLQDAPSQVFHLEAKSPSAFAVASQFNLQPGDVVFVGAAGVTRWSRFVNQLLPFTAIISNAASARNDLDN